MHHEPYATPITYPDRLPDEQEAQYLERLLASDVVVPPSRTPLSETDAYKLSLMRKPPTPTREERILIDTMALRAEVRELQAYYNSLKTEAATSSSVPMPQDAIEPTTPAAASPATPTEAGDLATSISRFFCCDDHAPHSSAQSTLADDVARCFADSEGA